MSKDKPTPLLARKNLLLMNWPAHLFTHSHLFLLLVYSLQVYIQIIIAGFKKKRYKCCRAECFFT